MHTRTRTEVRSSHLRTFPLDERRVALVPEQAVLLAGDHVTVEVRVAPGATLELVEPGGTVAYAMRGARARWDVTVEVGAGGTLVWEAEPFVVAEGADVVRTLSVTTYGDARVRLRETLVLGRTGEGPGLLRTRTDVTRDDRFVLVEEFDSGTGLGRHRVLDQRLHLGGGGGEDAMVLESGDQLERWLGSELHQSPLQL
ncbi:MAG TPA: urease accessory protein UreD [Nocardioides sp.]|uniref:urease accessory protein UreD n=1 Tax=uncultured Nocardioides sp. TaxID=198441 RepID=UPI000EC4A859|nr:urease accessory protein UreD [uncultured Nocardioides sp.]HCB03508.1 urease accessory protein [Nocardioides sp.]HRD64272.1 urease accessory protein UreD [Nocardioides sp.]HRI98194.1 urease accessory protein UreD [Nocardioides sp.]HRK47922.1 urease accessory protein UreD [Nocardioides sp.]